MKPSTVGGTTYANDEIYLFLKQLVPATVSKTIKTKFWKYIFVGSFTYCSQKNLQFFFTKCDNVFVRVGGFTYGKGTSISSATPLKENAMCYMYIDLLVTSIGIKHKSNNSWTNKGCQRPR